MRQFLLKTGSSFASCSESNDSHGMLWSIYLADRISDFDSILLAMSEITLITELGLALQLALRISVAR